MLKEKNKQANLFHLLGWEAGIVINHSLTNGAQAIEGWSYNSPRGVVTFHPGTHHTYAPLYYGNIIAGENNKCRFRLEKTIPITAQDHRQCLSDNSPSLSSGWKNNYLCI